jgi:hypothetical protein
MAQSTYEYPQTMGLEQHDAPGQAAFLTCAKVGKQEYGVRK